MTKSSLLLAALALIISRTAWACRTKIAASAEVRS